MPLLYKFQTSTHLLKREKFFVSSNFTPIRLRLSSQRTDPHTQHELLKKIKKYTHTHEVTNDCKMAFSTNCFLCSLISIVVFEPKMIMK